MNKAVIFDFGNVIATWDAHPLFASIFGSETRATQVMQETNFHRWNLELDAGRNEQEVFSELKQRHPEHKAIFDEYWMRWAETLQGPVPGVSQIIDGLVAQDITLYGLTNFNQIKYLEAAKIFSDFGKMRDVIVSGEVKLLKPDLRIFYLAQQRFGIDPQQTLFIDDSLANITAAASLGFKTHHFKGAGRLASHLASFIRE